MDRKQQIYAALKPKAKSFGFTKKELMSVASLIDDNLTLADDATDEMVTNAIDEQIEAVIPVLKLGQSYASRIIDANKPSRGKGDDDDDDDDEGNKPTTPTTPPTTPKNDDSETLKLLKSLTEQLGSVKDELSAMKAGRTVETRKSKLATKVANFGEYGKSKLRDFDRMTFKDDDDWEDWLSEVDEDLKALDKERGDKWLEQLGTPPNPQTHSKEGNGNVLSDDDVKALAQV